VGSGPPHPHPTPAHRAPQTGCTPGLKVSAPRQVASPHLSVWTGECSLTCPVGPGVGGGCGEDPGSCTSPCSVPAHRHISVNSPQSPSSQHAICLPWAQIRSQDGHGGRHGSQLILLAFFTAGHSGGQTAWKSHPTSHLVECKAQPAWASGSGPPPGLQADPGGPLLLCRMGRG